MLHWRNQQKNTYQPSKTDTFRSKTRIKQHVSCHTRTNQASKQASKQTNKQTNKHFSTKTHMYPRTPSNTQTHALLHSQARCAVEASSHCRRTTIVRGGHTFSVTGLQSFAEHKNWAFLTLSWDSLQGGSPREIPARSALRLASLADALGRY